VLTAKLFNLIRCLRSDERGQTGILFILTLVMTFGFMAMALDAGLWYLDHRLAQNQVDMAAHAGALYLKNVDSTDLDGARDEVTALITANRGGTADLISDTCDVFTSAITMGATVSSDPIATIITDPIISSDFPWSDQKVRVCIRRTSPSLLSSLAGMAGVYVSAAAEAKVEVTISEYALMAMKTSCPSGRRSMNIRGGVVVNLDAGWTYTGASGGACSGPSGDALYLQSNSTLLGGQHNYVGSEELLGTWTTNTGSIDILPDPYGNNNIFSQDAFNTLADSKESASTCRQSFPASSSNSSTPAPPDVYCLQGSGQNVGNVYLQTNGVYIFTRGLNVSGSLRGTNVLLYFTCRNNHPCDEGVDADMGQSGTIAFGSNSQNDLTGHSSYYDMLIWVDRTAEEGTCTFSIGGTSSQQFSGRLYARPCLVDIGGNAATAGPPIDLNLSIVGSMIDIHGNITYNINYEDFPIPLFTMYLSE
jgi:Flp pilus assembly protein TadG